MTHIPEHDLSDNEITTEVAGSVEIADGTDADSTDSTDADSTDGTDADSTDGTDADSTDIP